MSENTAEIYIREFMLICSCGDYDLYTFSEQTNTKVTCSNCGTEWKIKQGKELDKTTEQLNKELGF